VFIEGMLLFGIVQISESRELNFDGKKIHIYPATKIGTVYAQFLGYKAMRDTAIKEGWDVGLIVVDSFNAKFRRAFSGREMFPERSAGIHLAGRLQELSGDQRHPAART
jgi:hypothetical protein